MNQQQCELLKFVRQQHGDQRRKYTDEPYWYHLQAVAYIAWFVQLESPAVEIALCHDLLEDTDCTVEFLSEHLKTMSYAPDTIEIIIHCAQELTDVYTKENYPDLNRTERKHQEAIRLGGISAQSQCIKCIDLIDNLRTITEYDKGFAYIYVREILDILDEMPRITSGQMRLAQILVGHLKSLPPDLVAGTLIGGMR